MRYNESEANKKAPKKEKKEIPVKAGTKEYDYYNLSSAKKIPTKADISNGRDLRWSKRTHISYPVGRI